MANGFALERLIDPEGVPEDLLEWMFSQFNRRAASGDEKTAKEVGT